MNIQAFYDSQTATVTYVVADPATQHCAVIDPVLDYNPDSGRISTRSADRVIDHIRARNYTLAWILETHAHADHLTAATYLKETLGGRIGIGEHITEVIALWAPIFNTAHDTPLDGSQFDHLFRNNETFRIGELTATVLYTPGHTPACVSYWIGDAAFVGDTLFMPNYGTARTDFPGGDAHTMYRSIRRIFELPEDTRVFVGHDYPLPGKPAFWESTVREQRERNVLAHAGVLENEYVAERERRDHTLSVPHLLLPALQVNLRAGRLGAAEDNGVQYLKIPLNRL